LAAYTWLIQYARHSAMTQERAALREQLKALNVRVKKGITATAAVKDLMS
jgi:hypothetical protein